MKNKTLDAQIFTKRFLFIFRGEKKETNALGHMKWICSRTHWPEEPYAKRCILCWKKFPDRARWCHLSPVRCNSANPDATGYRAVVGKVSFPLLWSPAGEKVHPRAPCVGSGVMGFCFYFALLSFLFAACATGGRGFRSLRYRSSPSGKESSSGGKQMWFA